MLDFGGSGVPDVEARETCAAHFPPLGSLPEAFLSIESGPAAVLSSAETQIQAEEGEDDFPQRFQPSPRGNSPISPNSKNGFDFTEI